MAPTKKNRVKSHAGDASRHLSDQKGLDPKNIITKKNLSKSSFPSKIKKANELLTGAKLLK